MGLDRPVDDSVRASNPLMILSGATITVLLKKVIPKKVTTEFFHTT
jgi:hypothetical protein